MNLHYKPVANPMIVFREEFDDWAVLFDPDTGEAFGLNPVGAFIWKRLDGQHTLQNIVNELASSCEDVPDDIEKDAEEFIGELVGKGYAGFELVVSACP